MPVDHAATNEPAAKSGVRTAEAASALPFVISPPSSYEEFNSLVEGRPAAELSAAIRRIRVTNKAALASEGKRGLQVGLKVQKEKDTFKLVPQMYLKSVLKGKNNQGSDTYRLSDLWLARSKSNSRDKVAAPGTVRHSGSAFCQPGSHCWARHATAGRFDCANIGDDC